MKIIFIAAVLVGLPVNAAVIHVAPGMPFSKPSEAALLAEDGDVIQIEPGNYAGDVAIWRQNNLTIIGVNGQPSIEADGHSAESKAIWVIKGNNVTVDNIALSGARVEDGNGAGIRFEGKNLTVRNCLFKDNENGILTGVAEDSRILVEHTEFDSNGAGDGYTHNIYVGRIAEFEMRYSYSHGANSGHQVKSRAVSNRILFNRLADEADGNSSYLIDLPNAGEAIIVGNELQQGRDAENRAMIRSVQKTKIVNNTFLNQRSTGVYFVLPDADTDSLIQNNLFLGKRANMQIGMASVRGNHYENLPGLRDVSGKRLSLTSRSGAVDRGTPVADREIRLLLDKEYVHPKSYADRCVDDAIDPGAHEFCRKD